MSRLSMLMLAFLGVALLLPATGCGRRKEEKKAQAFEQQNVPQKLHDPLERDKDVRAMKQPGRWHVTGMDNVGRAWEGYLIAELAPDAYLSVGFFEWSAKSGGGRYRFEGTFDPATRTVRWTGFTIEDRVGNVANAHYQATLAIDGLNLTNGSWQGGISIPGTWSGEFVGEL